MARFSELKVKFTGDTSDLQMSLRQMGASISEASNQATRSTIGFTKLGQTMADVGQRLTFGLTVPMGAFGAAAIKMAGSMEVTQVAFTTMLRSGTAATAMLKDLKQFAMTTPFQFTELTDATRKMLALGFSTKEVIPTLRVIGDAAGALGLGAEGINRIVLAMGQMKAKGTVQAEEMRQLAEAGIPAWDALAKKLNTDVAGAMKMVQDRSVSAAVGIDAVMTAMRDRFGGGMAAQAKTLIGTWSNVQDALKFALADVGAAVLPIAKNILVDFVMPVAAGIQDMAKSFSELPGPIQATALAAAGLAAAIGPLLWAFAGMVSTIVAFSNAWKLAAVVLGGAVTVMANMAAAVTTYLTGVTAATASTAAFAALTGTVAAAIAVAAVAVYKLTAGYLALKDAQEQQKLAEMGEVAARERLIKYLKDHGAAIDNLEAAYRAGKITTKDFDKLLREFGMALGEAAGKTIELDEATKSLGFKTTKQLTEELKKAKEALVQVQQSFDRGASSAEDLARAKEAVIRISQQLHPSLKAEAEAWKNLGTAMQGPITQTTAIRDALTETVGEKMRAEAQKGIEAWQEAILRASGYGTAIEYVVVDFKKYAEAINDVQVADYWVKWKYAVDEYGNAITEAQNKLEALQLQQQDTVQFFDFSQGYPTPYDPNKGFEGGYAKPVFHVVTDDDKKKSIRNLQEISTVLNDLDRDLVNLMFDGGKFKDVMGNAAVSIGKAFSRMIVSDLMKPFQDAMKEAAKWVADLAQSIIKNLVKGAFGELSKAVSSSLSQLGGLGSKIAGLFGGGSSTASNAANPGGLTSGIGGAVSSGVTGIVGAVAGVATAISSIVGNFQMAGMNKSLDIIVKHTLQTVMIGEATFYLIDNRLNAIHDRLMEFRTAGIGVFPMQGYEWAMGGGGGGITLNFPNSSFIGFRDMDAFVDELVRRIKARL